MTTGEAWLFCRAAAVRSNVPQVPGIGSRVQSPKWVGTAMVALPLAVAYFAAAAALALAMALACRRCLAAWT